MKVNFRYDTGRNTEYAQRIAELVEIILDMNYIIVGTMTLGALCYNFKNLEFLFKFCSMFKYKLYGISRYS